MRLVWWVLAALLTLAAVPATAQSPSPGATGLGIRLLDAPTDRRDDPRAQVYVVDDVRPGASFTRRVEVLNDTGRAASVSLYPAASEIADGSFSVLPGRARNELTEWIRVTPETLQLGPGARAEATVTVAVPSGATGGERYAAVMAEVVEASDRPGVAVASRVGVRVYLSVSGDAEPPSDFEISTLQAVRQDDGRPAVSAQVRNTGGRALDMSGSLSLTEGPGGLSAGPFPAELGTTLAPGDVTPVAVVLDNAISGGPWTATLTLRSGRVERTAKATITFPDDAGEQAEPVRAEALAPARDPDVVVPVAVGVLAVTGALIAGTLLFRRLRARRLSVRRAGS